MIQLPSVRTLKLYIDANIENAGDSLVRLKHSWKGYESMVEERRGWSGGTGYGVFMSLHIIDVIDTLGCIPIAEGSLILDEVKV